MILLVSFKKINCSGLDWWWSDTPQFIEPFLWISIVDETFIWTKICQNPISAEKVIYEAFVLIGELRWSFSALPQWRKGKVETSPFFILSASWWFPFPPGSQWIEAPPDSPNQNKGFINYFFCRNWAVRNPAETRVDSL